MSDLAREREILEAIHALCRKTVATLAETKDVRLMAYAGGYEQACNDIARAIAARPLYTRGADSGSVSG